MLQRKIYFYLWIRYKLNINFQVLTILYSFIYNTIEDWINQSSEVCFTNQLNGLECMQNSCAKASYFVIMFSLKERKEHFCLEIYKRISTVCNPMVKGIVVLHPRIFHTFLLPLPSVLLYFLIAPCLLFFFVFFSF